MNAAVDPLYTGIVPASTIPESNADAKKRLMYCRLSGTSLTTVETNAPRMSMGSGQIKILRSGIYWIWWSWDFNFAAAVQDLQLKVNWNVVCQWYRSNYYTQSARFIEPISVKLFLDEGDIVTLTWSAWSYNEWVTWLSVFEENDEKVS